MDRRRRDVRDRRIGLRHEGRDEQDGEQPRRAGRCRVRRRPCACDAPPGPAREAPRSSAHAEREARHDDLARGEARAADGSGPVGRAGEGLRVGRPCPGSARGTTPRARPRHAPGRARRARAPPPGAPRRRGRGCSRSPDAGCTAWAAAASLRRVRPKPPVACRARDRHGEAVVPFARRGRHRRDGRGESGEEYEHHLRPRLRATSTRESRNLPPTARVIPNVARHDHRMRGSLVRVAAVHRPRGHDRGRHLESCRASSAAARSARQPGRRALQDSNLRPRPPEGRALSS